LRFLNSKFNSAGIVWTTTENAQSFKPHSIHVYKLAKGYDTKKIEQNMVVTLGKDPVNAYIRDAAIPNWLTEKVLDEALNRQFPGPSSSPWNQILASLSPVELKKPTRFVYPRAKEYREAAGTSIVLSFLERPGTLVCLVVLDTPEARQRRVPFPPKWEVPLTGKLLGLGFDGNDKLYVADATGGFWVNVFKGREGKVTPQHLSPIEKLKGVGGQRDHH
jgi:hypothetical protein